MDSREREEADKKLMELFELEDSDLDEPESGSGDSARSNRSQMDPTGVTSVAGFSTTSFGILLKAEAEDLDELMKIRGSSSRKRGRKKHKNTTEGEVVYVYDFGFRTENLAPACCDMPKLPLIYELYRTCKSHYVSFRVLSRENLISEGDIKFIQSLKTNTMGVSIMDNQETLLQAEKVSLGIGYGEEGLKFEIEDFASLVDLSDYFKQFGEIHIRVSFTSFQLFGVNVRSARTQRAPKCKSEPASENIVPIDFKEFIIQERFNSQFGTRSLNDAFLDASIHIKQEEKMEPVVVPIHRVTFAAQSPVLETMLSDRKAVLTIEGFSEETVRTFIDYIYSGEVYANDVVLLASLIKLADKFSVVGLKGKCVRNICIFLSRNQKTLRKVAFEYFRLGKQLKMPLFTQLALDLYKKSKAAKKVKKVRTPRLKLTPIGHHETEESNEEKIIFAHLEKLIAAPVSIEEPVEACQTLKHPITRMFSGNSTGYLYKLSRNVFEKVLESPRRAKFDEQGERICLELKYNLTFGPKGQPTRIRHLVFYKVRGQNDVNLRVMDTILDLISYDGDRGTNCTDVKFIHDKFMADSLDYVWPKVKEVPDWHFVLLLTHTKMRTSICHPSGRSVHEATTTSYIRRKDFCKVWEFVPFISAQDFQKFNILAKHKELILMSTEIPLVHLECTNQLSMDTFSCRLHAQLQNSLFSDGFIHMVDKDDRIVTSFPVHKVIISGYSKLLESGFTQASAIYVSVQDFSIEAMQATLHYVYGNHVPKITLELGLELLVVCQDLGIDQQFREYILQQLLNNNKKWTFEFGLIFFQYGHFVKVTRMKVASLQYFQRNWAEFKLIPEFQRFMKTFPCIPDHMMENQSFKITEGGILMGPVPKKVPPRKQLAYKKPYRADRMSRQ